MANYCRVIYLQGETTMPQQKPLSMAIAMLVSQMLLTTGAQAQNESDPVAEEMVITTVRMSEALTVETDPRRPRQPLPAHDGADFLKTIPGFSVIRKGGADGDPVFRGMAGSRLSMLVDGATVLGGCGHRMDPPTAYIFPEAFESIEVIKGPQSVQHGPGNAAGVVTFERNRDRVSEPGWKVHSSALAASFGRHDEVLDAAYKSPSFTLRGIATNAEQDNYKDGDGTVIHSAYHRWSSEMSAAWTPSDDLFVEFSAGRSDGEAAYADRGMDGSLFEREHYGFKASMDNVSNLITQVETQAYYQYIDHVMDNYTLRSLSAGTPQRAMNPDRKTFGGKLAATLQPTESMTLVLGLDAQENEHTNRASMNMVMMDYRNLPRTMDADFSQLGIYGEVTWDISDRGTVKTGIRADRWSATDQRAVVALTPMMSLPNPTTGHRRSDTLYSGFARYEHVLAKLPATAYVGFGHNERFPDYWELISKESLTATSAFGSIDTEKLSQIDAGLIYNQGSLRGSISVFYNEIADYILIDSSVQKPTMMTLRSATIARNIDVRSWGAEADITYGFAQYWRAEMTLASVRGTNKSDNVTLAQLPPLEARLGLHYDNSTWSFGTLLRAIDQQNRVDPGRGNIAGQDVGPTPAANVLSFNAGWKPSSRWMLTAGIDNALDKAYAEHISRSGASVAGYDQVARVNEPGRTLWLKAQFTL